MPTLRAIMLDSGPLGLLANSKSSPDSLACHEWVRAHLDAGTEIFIAEITDYEVRRELIQARLVKSVTALNALRDVLDYLALTTSVMRRAAELWAAVRQAGQPTTDRHALDGDVILAAQALSLGYNAEEIVVATTNAGHISRFVTAKRWQDIAQG